MFLSRSNYKFLLKVYKYYNCKCSKRLNTNHISGYISKKYYSSLPELTKDRYPISRGNYNTVHSDDINYFTDLLGQDRVLTESSDVEAYNVDWLKIVRGCSQVVLKPKTTEEVSKILKYCNSKTLAVCPQGGNTGLVGGSVPVFDEIVLSTSLMNEIIHLDTLSGVLTCQSGCILQNLDTRLKENQLMMPLDLGAKGSCQIGGNVSTNAGGIRLLRYGSLQGSVLGLEVVLADGEVIDLLSTLKKDNTGYHLKHLFIGSEGTLGIVTKVAIQCPPAPKAVNVAFVGVNKFEDILKIFQTARSDLGEILSSCEMMDELSLDVCVNKLKLQHPLQSNSPFYVLIETSGSQTEHDEQKLNVFLDKLMSSGGVVDGTVANEPSKMNHIWQLRERIAEGLLHDGYCYKYDISLPLPNFYELVTVMREKLKNSAAKRVCGYGHVGDGNLHLNITSSQFDHKLLEQIEPFLFEWTQRLRGSVSAEHGIGFKKTKFLHFSKSEPCIKIMKKMKQLLDPKLILNPYKVLPY